MSQLCKPKRRWNPRAVVGLGLAICTVFANDAQARAECVATDLRGLPEAVGAGERVRLTTELDSGCNYKRVDEATLVCVYPDGGEERHAVELFEPVRGPMHAEVVFTVPELEAEGEVECLVEFSQCNEVHRTCAVSMRWRGPGIAVPDEGVVPPPDEPVRLPEPRRRRPATRPSPPPEPQRLPPPPPTTASRDGGRFLRGLGWIGVGVGLGVYADASSKEQEGRFEESQESEELANQILGGSSVLLLIGYAMDGDGFVDEPEVAPRRRVQPSLSIDPFHRAVLLRVSVRFD